jgi:uncharacterized protein YkwD
MGKPGAAVAAVLGTLALALTPGALAHATRQSQGPCAGANITATAADLDRVRSALLCLVNRERVVHGLGALRVNRALERAAQSHSDDMVANDYFAHTSSSGLTVAQRLYASGYTKSASTYVIGENLAWGTFVWLTGQHSEPNFATAQKLIDAWMHSSDHRANILYGPYVDTGFGLRAAVPASLGNGAPGVTVTEDFGVVR